MSPLNLEELSLQHNKITDRTKRQSFYEDTLYPTLLENVVSLPTVNPPLDLLLLPVSNRFVPVLAAARWKPRVAFAIYSSRSEVYRSNIESDIAALGLEITCKGEKVDNIEIEPERLYKVIREIIQPFLTNERDNKHIAVDITGGTSVMSVASAMAVSFVGGRFFYILSGTTKDDITQREVGTEQLRPLKDPYTVFGDLEYAEAKRHYSNHNYERARGIFAKLAGTEGMPEPDKSCYQAYEYLTRGYAAWDVFDWQTAQTALQTLLASPLPTELESERSRLEKQHTMLKRLAKDNTNLEKKHTLLPVLKAQESVLALLGTLYANALRRAHQGRYDVAALFLYRSLELMSQHRLAREWDINTARPKYTKARREVPNFEAQYEKIEQRIFPNSDGHGVLKKKNNISLFNGYMLLEALEDPLVKDFKIEDIKERTDARNNSMLAHGFRLITKEEYNEFYAVVEQVLQRFLQVCEQDQAAWVKECSFLTPFGETPTNENQT